MAVPLTVLVRDPHPTRVELLITGGRGPLHSPAIGDFDPRRDVTLYLNGGPTPIQSFIWDAPRNRYVCYLEKPFDTRGLIQMIHHMPDPPFETISNPPLMNQSPGRWPTVGELLS